MNERLLTPADLAEVFGVTERQVLEYRKEHNWPATKIGRKYRWTQLQLEQIIASHAVKATERRIDSGLTALSAARSVS